MLFFYPSRMAWYIIRRKAVYHQRRQAAFAYHHGVSRAYPFLRLDEMQFLAELMIYSPDGLMKNEDAALMKKLKWGEPCP